MKKLISLVLVLALSLTAVLALAEPVEEQNDAAAAEAEALALNSIELEELMDGLTPSVEDIEIILPESLKDIVIELSDESADGTGENSLLVKLTDAESDEELNLENMYADENVLKNVQDTRKDADPADKVDLSNTASVAPITLPTNTVKNADGEEIKLEDLTDEQKDEILQIKVNTNQITNEYLGFVDDAFTLYAVFTYEKTYTNENGEDVSEIFSCIVDFDIVSDPQTGEFYVVYDVPMWVIVDASGCEPFVNFVVEKNEAYLNALMVDVEEEVEAAQE